jgi:hypothetical protein
MNARQYILVTRLGDGRCAAHIRHEGLPIEHELNRIGGAESSAASLARGENQDEDAIARLRQMFPGLPAFLPVRTI